VTIPGADDVPRSPTGRVPQWVLDEAGAPPAAPAEDRAAPTTYSGEPEIPVTHRRRGRSVLPTLIVALLIIGVVAWTTTGHDRPPAATSPTTAARPTPTTTQQHTVPPPGVGEAPTALGTPAAQPGNTSQSFAFTSLQRRSLEPVAFSPCRPIHYVVRPDNAPKGGDQVITRAMVAVSVATGLRFVFDGSTTEPVVVQRKPYQPTRYGDRWAPVLVAWATVDEVPDFGEDAAGIAGAQRVTPKGGPTVYVTGEVFLDAQKLVQIQRDDGPRLVQAMVEHEFGHLVGLAHVNDTSQLMFPRASRRVLKYQPGDLAGLAKLGRGACAPDA
jgi:hypothetical protein